MEIDNGITETKTFVSPLFCRHHSNEMRKDVKKNTHSKKEK